MVEIVKTQGTCFGRARIADTRMPIWLLAIYWRTGATDSEILQNYSFLTSEQLEIARQYIINNSDEIEADIDYQSAQEEEME